ncbi:MAG: Oxidoreductase [Deltaproteobacteria bacterium]|nr:Oxidoreductase [Deltaproteobacteria bacterium]
MKQRRLGNSGVMVSELGLGAGPLGGAELDDGAAERLVRQAIELGITLIDTAPSYGRSEQRIGAALRGRRDQVVVSTKLGYGVPGVADWTGPCITGGIDLALERLGTDRIDLAHLHSCPVEVLARGEVLDALERGVRAGKVRIAAYSGDGEALRWAIESGRFGVVQCSVSLADQRALDAAIPHAVRAGIGVLAKRPLANGAWREREQPAAPDRAAYWQRLRTMELPPAGVPPAEYALGFVLAQPVSSVLVGTTSLAHLASAVETARRGPLDAEQAELARAAFRRCDQGWDGVI